MVACAGCQGPNGSAGGGAGAHDGHLDARAADGRAAPLASAPVAEGSATATQDLEAGERALFAPERRSLRASLLARVEALLVPGIDGSDGWVLAHAVLGFGADFRIGERLGWQVLVREHGTVDGRTGHIVFGEAPRGVLVEPHLGLVAKAFASAGVDPKSMVQASTGEKVRAGQVALSVERWPSSAELRADAQSSLPGVPGRLDEVAWVLEASAVWDGTVDASRRTSLAQEALSGILTLYAPVDQARTSGAKLQRDGRGLFALTCGGAHLLQALFASYGATQKGGLERSKMAHLWSLARWRYDRELETIDGLLVAPGADRRALLGQRLKLTGHFLETLLVVNSSGLIDDRAQYEERLTRVEAEVIATLAVFEERGAFAGLTGATQAWSQTDRDLVGDALHAVRGLRLAL